MAQQVLSIRYKATLHPALLLSEWTPSRTTRCGTQKDSPPGPGLFDTIGPILASWHVQRRRTPQHGTAQTGPRRRHRTSPRAHDRLTCDWRTLTTAASHDCTIQSTANVEEAYDAMPPVLASTTSYSFEKAEWDLFHAVIKKSAYQVRACRSNGEAKTRNLPSTAMTTTTTTP